MVDPKNNMPKKTEQIPKAPNENKHGYNKFEREEGQYYQMNDQDYKMYQENIPENYRNNDIYQQDYRYNYPRMQYDYENRDYEKETSSSSDSKKPIKKGRKKIVMEYIQKPDKRSVTFSKRKKGIMKKAYELSVLTGNQVLLLIASDKGHVYTFATPKLKPMIIKHERLIQQCLNAPSSPQEMNLETTYKNEKVETDEEMYQKYTEACNNRYYANFQDPDIN
ncbi:transcription factor of the MADS box [Gurleya vavrai]